MSLDEVTDFRRSYGTMRIPLRTTNLGCKPFLTAPTAFFATAIHEPVHQTVSTESSTKNILELSITHHF